MALSGSYRKIVVKPEKLTWEFLKFSQDQNDETNSLNGLKINFILPSSAYATVCLRDLIGDEDENTKTIE